MKKLIYIFLILLLPLCFLLNSKNLDFYEVFNCGENTNFCFVYKNENFYCNLKDVCKNSSLKCVKNGSKWLVSFKDRVVKENIKTPEYMQVSGNFEDKFLQNKLNRIKAKFIKCEKYEDLKIYFYYTPVWKDFVIFSGSKVNLQIAVDNNLTTIGYPMIYGSF